MKRFALLLVMAVATVNSQWLVEKPDLKVDPNAVMTCIEDCLNLCKDGIEAVKNRDISKIPSLIEEATSTFADCKKAADSDMLTNARRFMMNDSCMDDLKNVMGILQDLLQKALSFSCDMDCLSTHINDLKSAAVQAKQDCS